MVTYVARRVGAAVVVVALTSVLIFVVLRVIPGDPVITRLGATTGNDPHTVVLLRHELGLDKSIPQQYFDWISRAVRGDLGKSYFSQYPVSTLIGQRLMPTIELTFVSLLFALMIALPAGLVTGMRPNSIWDRLLAACVTAGMAFPPFLLALVLISIFSVRLGLLPTRGYVPLTRDPIGNLRTVMLPALTLGIIAAAPILRFLRASLLEMLSASFTRTAEGKGLNRRQVVMKHALPNALIPTVTILGLIAGYTLGGVVIVEYVFGWQGLGALAIEAVFNRDYGVLQGVVLLVAALFMGINLAVDLLYGVIDPRLRVAQRAIR